jgi:hypothetical protein
MNGPGSPDLSRDPLEAFADGWVDKRWGNRNANWLPPAGISDPIVIGMRKERSTGRGCGYDRWKKWADNFRSNRRGGSQLHRALIVLSSLGYREKVIALL